MHDRHLVLTPEKVVVSYSLAGVGTRIGAHLMDLLFSSVFIYILALVAMFITMPLGEGFMTLVIGIISAFGFFVYFILCEWLWNGNTLGKKILQLQVVMVDGTPISFGASFWRNILRLADLMPFFYLAGFIAIFTNSRSQRLGDLVAGTVVIKMPKKVKNFTFAPHRVGVHPLEYSVGELHNMNLEEYHAIKRLCDRFPMLTPTEQIRNIEEIWVPFAKDQEIDPVPNVHAIYQMEAVVMKYGRMNKLV